MAKMHELLAVEPDAITVADKMINEALGTFSKKPDHFKGQAARTTYLLEERQNENYSDSKELVSTVDAKLDHTTKAMIRLFDVLAQRDATNQTTKADVVLDGKVIAKDLPGTFLLSMEQRLKQFRPLLEAVPTLDPAIAWAEDKDKGVGVWRSPEQTAFRTEKVLDVLTLSPATDKHPAQVKEYTIDKRVARVDTVHYAGAWSTARKAEVLNRLDKLSAAIKQARMRANMGEVVDVHPGKSLLDYVLKD